jgi:hypothetical protein
MYNISSLYNYMFMVPRESMVIECADRGQNAPFTSNILPVDGSAKTDL